MIFGKVTIKRLSGRRRNWAKNNHLILTGHNKFVASECSNCIKQLSKLIFVLSRRSGVKKKVLERLKLIQKMFRFRILKELTLPFDVTTFPLTSVKRGAAATIDGWDELRIPEDLRPDSRDDLRRLFVGFQFPPRMISSGGNVFTGEEVFLFGLYRLVNPGKYNRVDIAFHFGFHDPGLCSKCFHLFLMHMTSKWGYLITNNVDFWTPNLSECARAIADKCLEKGCYFPRDDFCIFGFIDSTMNSTCRPGGGLN